MLSGTPFGRTVLRMHRTGNKHPDELVDNEHVFRLPPELKGMMLGPPVDRNPENILNRRINNDSLYWLLRRL